MYKATNIDTDKALKAINDSRAIQERVSARYSMNLEKNLIYQLRI